MPDGHRSRQVVESRAWCHTSISTEHASLLIDTLNAAVLPARPCHHCHVSTQHAQQAWSIAEPSWFAIPCFEACPQERHAQVLASGVNFIKHEAGESY